MATRAWISEIWDWAEAGAIARHPVVARQMEPGQTFYRGTPIEHAPIEKAPSNPRGGRGSGRPRFHVGRECAPFKL